MPWRRTGVFPVAGGSGELARAWLPLPRSTHARPPGVGDEPLIIVGEAPFVELGDAPLIFTDDGPRAPRSGEETLVLRSAPGDKLPMFLAGDEEFIPLTGDLPDGALAGDICHMEREVNDSGAPPAAPGVDCPLAWRGVVPAEPLPSRGAFGPCKGTACRETALFPLVVARAGVGLATPLTPAEGEGGRRNVEPLEDLSVAPGVVRATPLLAGEALAAEAGEISLERDLICAVAGLGGRASFGCCAAVAEAWVGVKGCLSRRSLRTAVGAFPPLSAGGRGLGRTTVISAVGCRGGCCLNRSSVSFRVRSPGEEKYMRRPRPSLCNFSILLR